MKLYTTAQVAAMLGISIQRVGQLRQARYLGQRVGRDWVYTPGDIANMRQRNRPGRPRIKRVE